MGNDNRFNTQEECQHRCGEPTEVATASPTHTFTEATHGAGMYILYNILIEGKSMEFQKCILQALKGTNFKSAFSRH